MVVQRSCDVWGCLCSSTSRFLSNTESIEWNSRRYVQRALPVDGDSRTTIIDLHSRHRWWRIDPCRSWIKPPWGSPGVRHDARPPSTASRRPSPAARETGGDARNGFMFLASGTSSIVHDPGWNLTSRLSATQPLLAAPCSLDVGPELRWRHVSSGVAWLRQSPMRLDGIDASDINKSFPCSPPQGEEVSQPDNQSPDQLIFV